jgi:hypothetical protein
MAFLSSADSKPSSEVSTKTDSGLPSVPRFERFAAYGFSVDYPVDCVLELRPKSKRDEGEVAFKSSSNNVYFLSWGPLEKVKNLRDVGRHADYTIDRIRKNREAKIRDIKRESVKVNGHSSPFNHLWIDVERRGFLFGSTRSSHEIRSLHVHCENSSRYFMIYVQGAAEASDLQGTVMTRMIQSFTCH